MEINYLDFFSGIGGFHEGLRTAGFKFSWSGHAELDIHAKSIYHKHFPESEDLGSVTGIRIKKDGIEIRQRYRTDRFIPIRIKGSRWIVTGGWPCQDNSIAGKRKGQVGGTRSGLFDQIIRILSEFLAVGADVTFIGENVKGLYSVNYGVDFVNTITRLTDLDSGMPQLNLQNQLLNTRWFLPQNRERIYFVGHIRGNSRPQVFPIGEGDTTNISQETKRNIRTGIQPGENAIPGRCEQTGKNINGNASEPEPTCNTGSEKEGLIQTPIINTREGLSETRDESLCIDKNYHKGMDNHGQRTMIQVGAKTGPYMIQKSDQRLKGKIDKKDICPTLKAETKKGDIEPLIVEDFYPDRVRTFEECPTLRSDRNGLKVQTFRRARTDEGKAVRSQNMKDGEDTTPFGMKEVIKEDIGVMPTLTAGDGVEQRIEVIGGTQEHQRPRTDGNSPALPSAMGEGGGHTPIINRIRRLTPIECARLQGFPDDWCDIGLIIINKEKFDNYIKVCAEKGSIRYKTLIPSAYVMQKISDTQQYKCYGNTVSVPVVKAIGKRILKGINN